MRQSHAKWIYTEAGRKGFCPVCRDTIHVNERIAKFIPKGTAWRHARCIGKTAPDMPWSTSGRTPETQVERLMERVDNHTFSGFCDTCGIQLWGEHGKCRRCRMDAKSRRWHDRDED